jgi:hypothetical protein
MSELINITGLQTINILSNYKEAKFRFITKTKLGMTCSDAQAFNNERFIKHPQALITGFKKGALQTVQMQAHPDGPWLTIFSRTGKTIKLIDETILLNLRVGDINDLWYNTNLYNWQQYKAVNSKTWDSYAYQMNKVNQTESV